MITKEAILTTYSVLATWIVQLFLFGVVAFIAVMTIKEGHYVEGGAILLGDIIICWLASRIYPFVYVSNEDLIARRFFVLRSKYPIATITDIKPKLGHFVIYTKMGNRIPVYDTFYSSLPISINRNSRIKAIKNILRIDV